MGGNTSPLEYDKKVYAYVNEGGETHISTVGEILQEVSYAENYILQAGPNFHQIYLHPESRLHPMAGLYRYKHPHFGTNMATEKFQ